MLFLLRILILVIMLPEVANAATYYVGEQNCNDSGSGNAAIPFCSIQTGVDTVSQGDTLLIQTGTYNEIVNIYKSGASTSRITIQAAPNAKPIIDGSQSNFSGEGLLRLNGQSFVTIKGLTIRNSPYYGIRLSSATNIILENNLIDTTEHGGLIVDNASANIQIIGNELTKTNQCSPDCGIHEGITLSNVNTFTVAGNYVHDGLKEGIDAKDGSTAGIIYNNTVSKMSKVGIYLNHATAIKVYQNKIRDCGTTGLLLAVGDSATGDRITSRNDIYQNLISNSSGNGGQLWADGDGEITGNKIYNNVFYNSSISGLEFDANSSVVYDNIIRNNIFAIAQLQGITGGSRSANTVSHNLFFQTSTTYGDNQVTGDPLFLNAAGLDFRLQNGSPAIDKGFDMGLPKVNLPDIGAFEYGYVPPSPDAGIVAKYDGGSTRRDAGVNSDARQPDDGDFPNNSDAGTGTVGANSKNLSGGCQLSWTTESPSLLGWLLVVGTVVMGTVSSLLSGGISRGFRGKRRLP